ncbi:uncharacterized protein LOC124173978 [Ischnura elegans]|uniref:uncharacterized protein LOC124173978 n=1 Tax=Ischnura elegans TaxID=197161 RepID=UPI001ED894B8|nr:uncharacterized protein LOC124173978 [Ischnura elegans]
MPQPCTLSSPLFLSLPPPSAFGGGDEARVVDSSGVGRGGVRALEGEVEIHLEVDSHEPPGIGQRDVADTTAAAEALAIRSPINSKASNRILKRASFALIRERIHQKRSALDANAKELLGLHLSLSVTLSPLDWEYVDRVTMAQGELQLRNDTRRQKGKFERLSSRSEFTSSLDCNRVVINLTGKPLDSAKTSVLSKGLNFAPAPKSIPFLDFIGGVEQAIRKLPVEAADEIRSDVVMTLKRAVPPKPNLTREERNALHAIRRDPKIVVLPADKGNATVLMPTEEYHKKVNEILQDGSYRVLDRDPTDAIVRKTSALIKDTKMEPESKSNLTVRGAVPPRFYGLPKVHKNGIPLRPIVSAINAPTYNLARYLSSVLSPIVGHCVHHIKNSAEFVKTLGGIRIKPSDIMVSLDVVSLFTRVPLEDTFNILESKFDEMTVRLFRHVLKSTYFLYGGKYYEQMDGVPMGSPLSPAIANLFMEDFEEKALQSASLRPRYFFRYVDDTFVIWQHGRNTLDDFLSHMNQQHPNIKFTMEEENNNCIPFLDILIQRKPDGTLGHRHHDF